MARLEAYWDLGTRTGRPGTLTKGPGTLTEGLGTLIGSPGP